MTANETFVRDFVAAWSRLDTDELVEFFAPDGVYHNMPAGPVTGHDNLRSFIRGFIQNWNQTEWDILNIATHGDTVIVERLDRTKVGDINIDLPCCGVFEMENGKIKIWRDYFDMATYAKALDA